MRIFKYLTAVAMAMVLTACGGGGGTPGASPVTVPVTPGENVPVTPSPSASVAKIIVGPPSASTLNADGVTEVIFKISAIDKSNALVPNAVIDLSATNGVILSVSSVVTDQKGAGEVSMVADASDQNNRIAKLTASCSSCSASAVSSQISVTGASVSLTAPEGSVLVVGGSNGTLKATVKSALGVTMQDVPVSFASTDSLILSVSNSLVKTDSSGVASITVSGLKSGAASVNVSVLGNAKAQHYTVGNPASALSVSSPANNTIIETNNPQVIRVSAPGATSVTFTSVLGTFGNSSNTQTVAVVSGVASATLTVPQAGVAVITISDNSNRTVSLNLTVSPPVSAANKILLNASQTTLPVSTTGNQSSVQITARAIYSAGPSDQPVANVPIAFSMSGGPGGGEYLTPALVYTDATGVATATFYAGTSASIANGISIKADIPNKPVMTGTAPSSNDVLLTIGGRALSVAFGPASVLGDSSDKTLYIQAYSVQVTDANNNPVSNQVVTLRLRPVAFGLGAACKPTAYYCSEDANGNGSLDQGEDGARTLTTPETAGSCPAVPPAIPIGTLDTNLTPQNSDGGGVPATVVTNANGIAGFDFTYLKGSAYWVINKLTATVSSNGTESSKSTIFRPVGSVPDFGPPCSLPPSPYSF